MYPGALQLFFFKTIIVQIFIFPKSQFLKSINYPHGKFFAVFSYNYLQLIIKIIFIYFDNLVKVYLRII